ncbi:MAG: metal-dependent hydrolase [Firmicutes bacterium]|nr:metal-dependent hydrolase [Bacillota bacterium]
MAGVRVKWLGHAGFVVTGAGGKTVVVDPWLEGNPLARDRVEDLPPAVAVLVTHDHFDHASDAARVVERTGATLVGMPETVRRIKEASGLPDERVVFGGFGMNVGGTALIEGVAVTMTQAVHSSETGAPAGYVVRFEDGFTFYHAGDTGVFAGMELLGRLYPLDLALLPIGGVFTMDARQAAAATALLRPRRVIPMHFRTFPILAQDASEFAALVRKEAPGVEVVVLEPGREVEV